jgi:hypothetical protein
MFAIKRRFSYKSLLILNQAILVSVGSKLIAIVQHMGEKRET